MNFKVDSFQFSYIYYSISIDSLFYYLALHLKKKLGHKYTQHPNKFHLACIHQSKDLYQLFIVTIHLIQQQFYGNLHQIHNLRR